MVFEKGGDKEKAIGARISMGMAWVGGEGGYVLVVRMQFGDVYWGFKSHGAYARPVLQVP